MNLVRIFEIVWLDVVIELISSNWKVFATCAELYITYNFFSCKRVINELTQTRHICNSSHKHQFTRRQEVNKKKLSHASPPNIKTYLYIPVKMQEYTCS